MTNNSNGASSGQHLSDENSALNFAGLTHDHTQDSCGKLHHQQHQPHQHDHLHQDHLSSSELCSAITILRRHPMYDCLILVKKYRQCLGGLSLEFPLDRVQENELEPTNESPVVERARLRQSASELNLQHQHQASCNGRRLVSRLLDGDDPIFCATRSPQHSTCSDSSLSESPNGNNALIEQFDDRGVRCELVHVPVNGLLDRLAGYTSQGIAVDSRVYAFAMGLKTAERLMSTKSLKELQETPI